MATEIATEQTWQPITVTDPPDNVVLLTCIHDAYGRRNVQKLYRQGRLWFLPDGSMYVYYTPTHYVVPTGRG